MSGNKRFNPNSKAVHDYWRSNFDRFNDITVTWISKAHELKLASNTIYREFKEALDNNMSSAGELDEREGFSSIWIMLCGYSLECLLKGFYFSINPNQNIKDGKIIVDWKGSGHNLVTLVSLCDEYLQESDRIVLSEDEKNYLLRASEFTTWAGKYPLPKTFTKTMPVEQSVGIAPLTLVNVIGDKLTFESLYSKFSNYTTNC